MKNIAAALALISEQLDEKASELAALNMPNDDMQELSTILSDLEDLGRRASYSEAPDLDEVEREIDRVRDEIEALRERLDEAVEEIRSLETQKDTRPILLHPDGRWEYVELPPAGKERLPATAQTFSA